LTLTFQTTLVSDSAIKIIPFVGTECTLVHCGLYTGCICRMLTPRELRNQVVNLHCFATPFFLENNSIPFGILAPVK
jgi:hypothetical protein